MKRLSLILSFIILLASLCSCSSINSLKQKISPPVENAGEIVTAPHQTDTSEPEGTESAVETQDANEPYDGSLGSAGTLDRRTVVMTIFANDAYSVWQEGVADNEMKSLMLDSLGVACGWICDQAAKYGKTSEFIYDWNEHPDLKHGVIYKDYSMITNEPVTYERVSRTISRNLNANMILKDYEAENIIYLLFYNTDFDNETRPFSFSHVNSENYNVEFITIPVRSDGEVTSPTTIAHEMLHLFGAYDLFDVDNNPIPIEYIDHLTEIGSDDIMKEVEDGEEITKSFSDLDAYYTGLTGECADIADWNLPVAERFISK